MAVSMDKIYRDEASTDRWRILCTDAPGPQPVVAINQDGRVQKFTKTGGVRHDGVPAAGDLIEAKTKVQCEVWIWRLEDGSFDYSTEPERLYPGSEIVARVPIDVEEGHGLVKDPVIDAQGWNGSIDLTKRGGGQP